MKEKNKDSWIPRNVLTFLVFYRIYQYIGVRKGYIQIVIIQVIVMKVVL